MRRKLCRVGRGTMTHARRRQPSSLRGSSYVDPPYAILLAVLTPFLCVDASAASEEDTVVATVGAESIHESDVQRMLRKVTGSKQVNPSALPKLRAEVLQQLVDRRLLLAYAQRTNSGAAPAEIEKALVAFRAKLKSRGRTLDEYLKEQAIDQTALRRRMAWNLTWPKLFERYATEERTAAYFKEHRREFDGTRVSVSHILLRSTGSDDPVQQAETLRREITSGKVSFAEAARRHSAGPSGKDGGRLGPIARHGTMGEAFSRAAFGLEVGQISEPVRTRFGVHLIRCDEIQPGKRPLKDVRQEVQAALARELLDSLARYQERYTTVKFADVPP